MTGPFRPSAGGPAGFPGQGGQQQPHPTVGNLGMPGAPVQVDRSWQNGGQQQQPPVQQFNQPADQGQGGWQMPAAPQQQNQTFPQNQQQPNPQFQQPNPQQQPAQPHPTVPYGQPGAPQQGQPVQQQGQPGGQRADLPDNLILDGASVPPELRGRTWGQVKQIYGALANDFLLRQNGGQQQQQQPQQRQQAAPQQRQAPVYTQGVRNGGQPDAAPSFWEDPEAAIGRAVDARLAPITQRTTAMAIQEAKQVAQMGIPDFQYLEAEVLQIMAGADPNAMADPRLWQSSADLARGRLMARGEYDPRMAQQRQPQGAPNPAQIRGPGGYVPAPVAPMGQFFTEAPTPPMQNQFGGYGNGMNNSITQEEHEYAQKMQMSDAEYVAWRGGVQPTAPTRRY